MTDRLEKIGNSLIQHGPNSSRVYLMKLDPADLPALHDEMEQRVREHGYGKIFAKIPADASDTFLERGYREEARIPGYFQGSTDALFMCCYSDRERETDRNEAQTTAVLDAARAISPETPPPFGARSARVLTFDDIPVLAELYRQTFASYPFPITETEYLARTMAEHVVYFGVFEGDRLVAASSGETDRGALAVEMTDFATLPPYRGQGLARGLLATMDAAMRDRGMRTGYTIARAVSHGMNITFARSGYRFGGTLINNTGISGALESMNVWFRSLRTSDAGGKG